MKKYTLIFGTDFNNHNKLDNTEIHQYYDINDDKTLGDLKDFITCFNSSLCTCMLKLYIDDKHRFYKMINDKVKLKDISIEDKIYIGQIEQQCKCNFLNYNKDLISFDKRSLIDKINNLEKKKELEELQAQDFYDIIININSIKDINKGWKIEMTEKGEAKYKTYKEAELIKIGVVGNINKGKSFILSKLSKINLPTGTSINTKGLSVKYPDLEDGNEKRKLILLDSAGFEKPILRNEILEEEEKKEENIKINAENVNEINEKNDIIEEEKEENIKINNEKINEIKKEEKKEEKDENNNDYQKFKTRVRDILITESFLQSFIISVSDILLVIIDALSISEQKLIDKIKRETKIKKETKKIFVIHNLKTYRTKKQVELYINEILLKSLSFRLRTNTYVTANKNNTNSGVYFTETNLKDLSVFHLIFAADGSPAGDYYNKFTIDFIEGQYNNDWKREKFDVVEEIKKIFSENSKRYLEQKIELNEFKSTEDNIRDKEIKLIKEKELSLKKCVLDEIGLQTFKLNGFEPKYNYFKNGNNLEIRVELPGNIIPTISPPELIGENTVILIEGEKKKDKDPAKLEDNILNTRDFGKFNLEIQFKTEDYKIASKIKHEFKKGILIIIYKLAEKVEKEKIELKNEDEM